MQASCTLKLQWEGGGRTSKWKKYIKGPSLFITNLNYILFWNIPRIRGEENCNQRIKLLRPNNTNTCSSLNARHELSPVNIHWCVHLIIYTKFHIHDLSVFEKPLHRLIIIITTICKVISASTDIFKMSS